MIEYQTISRLIYSKQLKEKRGKIKTILLLYPIIYRENDCYTIKVFLSKFGFIYCIVKSLLLFGAIILCILPCILWFGIKSIYEEPLEFLRTFNYLMHFKDCKRNLEYEIKIKNDFVFSLKKELKIKEHQWKKYLE